MNYIIDTHAHLYDEQYEMDRSAMVQRSIDAGVQKIFLPNCNHSTIEPMLHLCRQWPQHIYPMIGLHPCYVKENFEEELAIMQSWMSKEKFYAIGEIGLDYYWDKTFVSQQSQAFQQQILWANELHLPIVIHSRESTKDCIDHVAQFKSAELKGVFHCYSGSLEEAHAIRDIGFYLGIGGVVTYKKSNLPEIIQAIGLQGLVLETDAPYLSPVPFRGKRNESAYTKIIAEKVAEVLQLPLEKVIQTTTNNALQLFQMKP